MIFIMILNLLTIKNFQKKVVLTIRMISQHERLVEVKCYVSSLSSKLKFSWLGEMDQVSVKVGKHCPEHQINLDSFSL